MNRKINQYKLVAFDLDGTLYDQKKLRMTMAFRLMGYYISHPLCIKELFVLQKFRSVREHWDELSDAKSQMQDSLDQAQYCYVGKKMNIDPKKVQDIVNRWIYENPLNALKGCMDQELKSLIDKLRKEGIIVVIFSDYPIEDKLSAMDITVDGMYAATDERLMELKPSPKGLLLIMDDFHVSKQDVLMIGDRDSKDGGAARAAGVDYLILDRNVKRRDLKSLSLQ